MEFTPDLLAFQGVLISADYVQPFSKLTEKGGNKEKVKYVVDCVRKYLLKENHISEIGILEHAVEIMRKFALYIILNSDLKILEEMTGLQEIDALIWTVPTISQHLMCEIMWEVYMDTYISEILTYTTPNLALQVSDAFLTNLKYYKPESCLKKLHIITEALYKLTCRFNFFILEGKEIEHANINFQRCMDYFVKLPNFENNILSEDQLYYFHGTRLCSMLSLIHKTIIQFINLLEFKTYNSKQIYEATYKEESIIKDVASIKVSEGTNEEIKKCIDHFNTSLLDTCNILVMDINVEVFCAWSEFEEEGITLQKCVSNAVNKVYPLLCSIKEFSEHPLLLMLPHISEKPINISDEINATDSQTISDNINRKDNESSQWVKALIYKENVCNDTVLLSHISSNLNLFTEEECQNLLKIVYDHLKKHSDKYELKTLVIRLFSLCNARAKEDFLNVHFKNQCFNDLLKTEHFSDAVTTLFNKLIDTPNDDLTEILDVFIQCPKEVFSKIFALAIENAKQTDIMLKIIKFLQKYTSYFYAEEIQSSVINITIKTIETKLGINENYRYFSNFLKGMKEMKIITGPVLLVLIIMPNLCNCISKGDLQLVYIHCVFILEIYKSSELAPFRAPMLVMLARVMETARWWLNTFEAQAPQTLTLAIQLQIAIMGTFTDIPEKQKTWLKHKLKYISPLNLYYFRELWQPPGKSFVEIVSGTRLNEHTDKQELTVWLSQVLCRSITPEWYNIWDSLVPTFGDSKTLDMFHKAVVILILFDKSHRTKQTERCIFYCLGSYILLLRYKVVNLPTNIQNIKIILWKLISIENVIETNIEDTVKLFLPILGFVADISKEYSERTSQPIDVITRGLRSELKHDQFRQTWDQLFGENSGR